MGGIQLLAVSVVIYCTIRDQVGLRYRRISANVRSNDDIPAYKGIPPPIGQV